MVQLWIAGAALLVSHFGLSSAPVRGWLVATIGEPAFRGLYSLVAIAALGWLIHAYSEAPYGPVLWRLGNAGAYLAILIMPLALLLLVGGMSQPNPTAIGGERFLETTEPARGVLRLTRHPVMWGIGLWGLVHVAANGDLASVGFFGSLAALALLGTLVIDAKTRRNRPGAFTRLAAATSNLPFLAAAEGRQNLGKAAREFGLVRMLAVIVLYAALLHGHQWLFGVAPYPVGG